MAATSPITPAPPRAKAAGVAPSAAERPAVVGLVLAAGGGRRLGGRPKALLDHGGRPLVERAVRAARAGGCAPVVHVVLGAAAERVRERADLAGCVVADNPDWATGMGSSLRAGLASVRDAPRGGLGPGGSPSSRGASAVLVLLVDQPGVGAEAVARMVRAHRAGAGLVAAAYEGRRGHPVLFARQHWAQVAALAHGDRGARDFLRAHAADLTLVECADIASCADIDTPADLRLLDPDR
ncbi:nucleotidyltransferase family protein [Streptomyces sp. AC536]|uniref:nucleotidyltransferase family protein n=1 Tax=Streptomyces buecherae TaxID=2763006 RepID=UPI00164D34C1|nr:nucleotidyltransferase family protein [Streptomyces buecherae]MBC3981079.1 nucleotidyltransferase family protein [Streptomyces buecherae]QNJ39455.1 nucleotidyltransferase family protein [Streptomyces buecherae]